jgi:hypothetical protein
MPLLSSPKAKYKVNAVKKDKQRADTERRGKKTAFISFAN